MEEKVARERIEPGTGAPSRAEKEGERRGREISRRRFIFEGSLAIGLALLEAGCSYPLARAALEKLASAPSEVAPEVLAADEPRVDVIYDEVKKTSKAEKETTIEEISVEEAIEFLQDLQNKIDEIYELRRRRAGWSEPYIVQAGDTLGDIAERHRVSVDRLAELNKLWLPDPNLIYPGDKLNMPEEVVPTPALGEVFAKVESDQERLQILIDEGQGDSSQAKKLAREIINFWNTPSVEKISVGKTEVVIHSECSKEAERIREMIQEFVDLFPNLEKLARKIEIVPREGGGETTIDSYQTYFFNGWATTYKDSPADICVRENYMNEDSQLVPWTREKLYPVLIHECLAHGGSLYGGGYILRFLAPAQIINFVHKDTKFWDEIYSQAGVLESSDEYHAWDRNEEEVQASSVESLFWHSKPPEDFLTKERMEKLKNFLNELYSCLLDSPVDVSQLQKKLLGKKLGATPRSSFSRY